MQKKPESSQSSSSQQKLANAVKLTPLDSGGGAVGGRRVKILAQLNTQVRKYIMGYMPNMINQTDNMLFSLANNVYTDKDQLHYLEAMRDLHLKSKEFEASFLEHIDSSFQQAGRKSNSLSNIEEDSLSLVDDDAHEAQIAIAAMISKNRKKYVKALIQLEKRVGFLTSREIDEANNPLGIELICEALSKCCCEVKFGIRIRLVFFKMFENCVLSRLGPFYDGCNVQLAKIGILPDLKPDSWRIQNKLKEPVKVNVSERVIEKVVQETINSLFANLQKKISAGGGNQYKDNVYLLPTAQAPQMADDTVVNLLNELQKTQSRESSPLNIHTPDLSSQLKNFDVIKLLEKVLIERNAQEKQSLSKRADQTIMLVKMLFDFTMDDKNLCPEMKVLIARLQIPIIKIALNDPSFFGVKKHPAYQLLNEISSEALYWSPDPDLSVDPLFCKIEKIIEKVIEEFDSVMVFHFSRRRTK